MVVTLTKNDVYAGNLILVNQAHAYQPHAGLEREDLVGVSDSGVRLKKSAAVCLKRLLRAVRAQKQIAAVSGWRSGSEQQRIWDDSLAEYGKAFTETYVALPGHSEHQTGLAIDLGRMQDSIDFIRPDFPYAGICGKFRECAPEYGFVERYPKGREAVTGIGHEPWHFRYVGVPHAYFMAEHGMTLEEYIDFLRRFSYGHKPCRMSRHNQVIDVSFQKADLRKDAQLRLELEECLSFEISGNNVDGFIITQWRETDA